jgi:DNA-binding response OmpR family regulator
MATILIVEDDGLLARHMARILRGAGHTPILASDAGSALQEVADRPDIVLLDLGLPDVPGEELLRHLKNRPETAGIPVLVVTGKTEAAGQLKTTSKEIVSDILLKPVSGSQLCQAVDTALAGQPALDPDALQPTRELQRDLIQRLIVEGPDALVFHICRRLSLDRMGGRGSMAGDALTWADIAEWGKREGLLDAEQAHLLRRLPQTGRQRTRAGSA